MALGQKHNNHKVMYSIIYGIVIYNAIQILLTLILIIPGFINPSFRDILFNNKIPSIDFLNCYLGFANIVTILITIGIYIVTTKVLENQLNLD